MSTVLSLSLMTRRNSKTPRILALLPTMTEFDGSGAVFDMACTSGEP
jgi:hypothetical protein